MMRALDFSIDGRDWPNHETSHFVSTAGLRWHVQESKMDDPSAQVILLLHGTGAATHSWRGMLPDLGRDFRVVAIDLPGHGFTTRPPVGQLSLEGMAMLIVRLMETMEISPDIVVGHSAGAAIGARMCLDRTLAPKGLVSLAGALLPLGGARGGLYYLGAKLVALNPLMPRMFAWRARKPEVISDLMKSTGSKIDADGIQLYARLAQNSRHAGAALSMMSNWDLQALKRTLPKLEQELLIITAENDGMIPMSYGEEIHRAVLGSEWVNLPGLGHLAHEEDPAQICQHIRDFAGKLAV